MSDDDDMVTVTIPRWVAASYANGSYAVQEHDAMAEACAEYQYEDED